MSTTPEKPGWARAVERHREVLEAWASHDLQMSNEVATMLNEYDREWGGMSDSIHHHSEFDAFVYVAEAEPGAIKIGYSKSPDSRVRSLNTANPSDIDLLIAVALPDAVGVEADLHDEFDDRRMSGEWFELEQKEVYELVGRLLSMHKREVG